MAHMTKRSCPHVWKFASPETTGVIARPGTALTAGDIEFAGLRGAAGTRDPGQQVCIALTRADIVAGLSATFITIIADRLIAANAQRLRQRYGMS